MNAKTQVKEPTQERPAAEAAHDPLTQAPTGGDRGPVAVQAQALPALTSTTSDDELGALAGMGNENVTRDNMATPFLILLQSGSPQAKRLEPAYIPGAEEGMFFNTVTRKLYDGKAGLEVINCYFEELILRWEPRGQGGGGGGFRGVIDPNDPQLAKLPKKQKNGKDTMTLLMPDGTEVNNVHQHYILARPFVPLADGQITVTNPHSWEPMVLGLGSTQIKKSRNLNAQINLQRVKLSDGREVQPPRFATVWRLTAVAEKNADGAWAGVLFTPLRRVVRSELLAAKEFAAALMRGEKKAKPEDLAQATATAEGTGDPGGAGGVHAGKTVDPDGHEIPY